jgi:hypothetical protein
LFEPRPGTLTEAEIHARLVEALGELGEPRYRLLRKAAQWGLAPYTFAFLWNSGRDPRVARYAPIVLYRTLGPNLPAGMAPAASLWGICQLFVRRHAAPAARAGFGGLAPRAANRLFEAILDHPSGVVFAVSEYEDSWQAVRLPGQRINLCLSELVPEIEKLSEGGPPADREYPFVLSAGERRTETSNTQIRDASWHRKGAFGTLRMCSRDAAALGCSEGDWVSISTRRGSVRAPVEISPAMQPGHVSLPNGLGLDHQRPDGVLERKGVALNELTNTFDRDPIAGTPWHKRVPARIERVRDGTHASA